MAVKEDNNKPVPVYQLKVTLTDIRPPIWRRIWIPGDVTLYKLHKVIQVVMGWWDYHLHLFTVGETDYAVPSPDDPWPMPTKNEKRARLFKVAPVEKSRFSYEYDLGDSWTHDILIEKIFYPEKGVKLPVCIAGKRAAPPEDCGGTGGYSMFIEAVRDPEHPEHQSMLDWAGNGEFDPEEFDKDEVNRLLGKMR